MRTLVPNPSSGAPRFSKQRRPFLEPIAYPKEYPHFEKPPLTNNVNLTLPLRAVLPEDADRAEAEGRLVFHLSGDTGSIHGDNSQVAIAEAMEQQVKSACTLRSFTNPTNITPHPYSPLRATTTAIPG